MWYSFVPTSITEIYLVGTTFYEIIAVVIALYLCIYRECSYNIICTFFWREFACVLWRYNNLNNSFEQWMWFVITTTTGSFSTFINFHSLFLKPFCLYIRVCIDIRRAFSNSCAISIDMWSMLSQSTNNFFYTIIHLFYLIIVLPFWDVSRQVHRNFFFLMNLHLFHVIHVSYLRNLHHNSCKFFGLVSGWKPGFRAEPRPV